MIAHSNPHDAADSTPSRLKVLRLVKELQALSDGTDSPAESASAAAKAQSLLLKHNLSMTDVAQLDGSGSAADPLVEEKCEFGQRKVDGWRQMLVQTVAASCLCEWMTSFYRQPGPRTYSFIGRQSNVEVAAYSYRCLERQVLHLGELEKRRRKQAGENVRLHMADFYEGVIETIRQRLEEGQRSFVARGSDCRAVVRTRGQEAEAHRAALYPHVTFSTRTKYYEPGAREAGMAAGRDVQLYTGLKEGGKAQRLLGGDGGGAS